MVRRLHSVRLDISAQISESFDVTVWVNNHQMHVDCFLACLLMDSKTGIP
jgi:hypothetical protein